MFLVIADYDENGIPTKINECKEEKDAMDKVTLLKFGLGYLKAFYCAHPGGDPNVWQVEEHECSIDEDKKIINAWDHIRVKRNQKLKASDWRMLIDIPDDVRWATYRRKLRDITEQDSPFNVEWPVEPS